MEKLPFFVRATKNGIESFRYVFVLGLFLTCGLPDDTNMPISMIHVHVMVDFPENHVL